MYLIEKKKLDQRALLISAGVFFIAIGVVFTTFKICYGDYYILKNTTIYIRNHWVLYVLPYIIGVVFILGAIFLNKAKESIKQMFSISAFVSTSLVVLYGIVCVLCSIKKVSFQVILANAYNNYFMNFFFSLCLGLIIAMVIYAIGAVVREVIKAIKNMLKDAE